MATLLFFPTKAGRIQNEKKKIHIDIYIYIAPLNKLRKYNLLNINNVENRTKVLTVNKEEAMILNIPI